MTEFWIFIRGVGDEGRPVLDPAIGVAVAELRGAERLERPGVGRDLRGAECLDILGDGIFIRRSREGRDDARKSNGKSRPNGKSPQRQLTAIDSHRFLRFFVRG